MSENKTGKYLKYAIGEILLVMVGILLALQVNNWNEELNAKEELKTSMNLMLDDLKQDISFYDYEINRIKNRVSFLNNFVQGNYSEIAIESAPDVLAYNLPNKKFGTTYISLKEDRLFNMIKNMDLKKKITSYYEVTCEEYSVLAEWHRKLVTETIENYLILNLPYKSGYSVNAKDVINDLENGKLQSLSNYQIAVQTDAITLLMNNKNIAEKMSVFINSEFN